MGERITAGMSGEEKEAQRRDDGKVEPAKAPSGLACDHGCDVARLLGRQRCQNLRNERAEVGKLIGWGAQHDHAERKRGGLLLGWQVLIDG